MTKYKLILLRPGMTWPKWGVYDDAAYKEDMEDFLEQQCYPGSLYSRNVALFKEERPLAHLEGVPVEMDYWCVVIDDEPEVNEFGVVSP